MNLVEFARILLESESISDKLSSVNLVDELDDEAGVYRVPARPGRSPRLQFSERQIKFPKKTAFHQKDKRALALHFFANHELLAIEMMACALIIYPSCTEDDRRFKRDLLKTIADEQKHLSLYCKRMNEFGVELGDYPINDFFWRQMHGLKTPQQFYALMALTFEQANLDFAAFYRDLFFEVEDEKSASIMQVIYEDEIVHVARGVKWLRSSSNDKSLWEYYQSLLPENISPARAKGVIYDQQSRQRAGLDDDFMENLKNYTGEFNITRRKQW